MTHNEVKEKSLAFAKRVVNAYRYLGEEKNEHVLSKQFLRSGTSIGATSPKRNTPAVKRIFSTRCTLR